MAGNSPRDQSEIEEEDRRSSEKCRRASVSACGENSLHLRVKNSDTVLTECGHFRTETRCEDIRCNAV